MKTWTRKMTRTLRSEYASCESTKELAERLGVSTSGLKSKAKRLGIRRRRNDRRWTEQQDALLRQSYASTPMPELMALLHRSQTAIYNRVAVLGLRKSREYLVFLGRKAARHPDCVAHQFKKGRTPFNKGLGEHRFRRKEGIERCRATQFKAGHIPHNIRPAGYECIHSDGYVYIKVEGERRMLPKHRHVWRQHHGDIPQGMCVAFRDGNRQNCDISNLMLITEAEKATRVTAALSPEQMRMRHEKAQSTRNEAIRKDKMRIRWGLQPKGKLVKRWHPLNDNKQ